MKSDPSLFTTQEEWILYAAIKLVNRKADVLENSDPLLCLKMTHEVLLTDKYREEINEILREELARHEQSRNRAI